MTSTYERKGGLPPPGRAPRTPIRDREDCPQIEAELLAGKSVRAIAKKYGVHEGSLYKHRKGLPAALKAMALGQRFRPGCDLEQVRKEESEGLLLNLAQQRVRLLRQQDTAIADGNHQAVATLAAGIHRNLELAAKLLGEIQAHSTRTTISLLVSPEYLQLRNTLIRALAPYPEARKAVAAAIYEIENSTAGSAPPIIDVTPALSAPANADQ
jgi:transposase-like protein